ncbi:MAG: RrF2 family transcriptional regulator, partial [Pseudonocardia sp.]
MSSAVEWGVHCCVTLGWVSELGPTPITRLAAWFGLPPEYLKKRLQQLVKAGILESVAGQTGGYGLARPPESITLMDVVAAVEGRDPAFRCTEIRKGGLCGEDRVDDVRGECGVAVAMHRA